MEKRDFLAAVAAGAASGMAAAAPGTGRAAGGAGSAPAGPGLLTVAGAVGRGNRGALDPVRDQLMVKHGARFDRAWVFDAPMLARLPAVVIEPTLEYDAKPHRLRGPTLETVLRAAGVAADAPAKLMLRAIDGYTVETTLADARASGFIVATAIDGAPMSLGGLGPLWAVYDADRLPTVKDKPLKERFAGCPWGLYYIEVQATT